MTRIHELPADHQRVLSAARSRASRQQVSTYCIDGEQVTRAQIAKRLGISVELVASRLREARRKAGPVTWEALR